MPVADGGWQSQLTGSDTEARVTAMKRGGTAGQVLTKASDNDLDTEWADPQGGGGGAVDSVTGTAPIQVDNTDPANPVVGIDNAVVVPAGGTTGQVLAKASDTDHDIAWVDQTGGGGSGEYVTFVPQDAATMPNLTMFIDQADGLLKFKASDGTLYEVGLAPIA